MFLAQRNFVLAASHVRNFCSTAAHRLSMRAVSPFISHSLRFFGSISSSVTTPTFLNLPSAISKLVIPQLDSCSPEDLVSHIRRLSRLDSKFAAAVEQFLLSKQQSSYDECRAALLLEYARHKDQESFSRVFQSISSSYLSATLHQLFVSSCSPDETVNLSVFIAQACKVPIY